ncbi:MAG: hypothetical protein Q4B88_06005 [Moraxella sp.]|nr:hypothetical protein [Moraxella sp.]
MRPLLPRTQNTLKKTTLMRALTTIWANKPTKKTEPKTPPTQKKPSSQKKKWAVFFLLMLVVLPSAAPAKASVFDPIVQTLLPFYQKISKKSPQPPKDTSGQPTPSPAPTSPSSEVPTSYAALYAEEDPVPTFSPKDSISPDLFALLQAEFAASRDDPKAALELYKTQSFKENATAVFERALNLSMQLESAADSLAFAKAWQEVNQDHVPVWFYVTHLALKAEDYPTVAQNLRLILNYDPNADLSQLFSGIFPSSPASGRALLNALQAVDGDDNVSFSVLKAGVLAQLGEVTPAVLYLNNAIKASPNHLAYLTLKADILSQAGEEKKLLDFLNTAIRQSTGETKKQLYLYQVRYFINENKLPLAWETLKKAHNAFKDDAETALLGSLVALDIKAYADANRLLTPLTALPNLASEAHYYLGISHERTHDYETALSHFRQVNDMQFVLPATKKQVAYELLFGNPDNAIAALTALRDNFEMYASESYTLQADILLKMGKKAEAYTLLMDAYRNYPDDLSLLYAATQLLSDESDFDEKQNNLNTLLSFEPNNPAYRLDLAKLILSRTPDDAQSLATAQEISVLPADSFDYDSRLQLSALLLLAQYDLNKQNYQAVIDALEVPYELSPDFQVGIVLLRAYQGLGNFVKVSELLADLTARFGNTNSQNTPDDASDSNVTDASPETVQSTSL